MTKDIFMTTKEIAERYRVMTGTIRTWRYKGIGPKYLKKGGHVLYKISDVEEWEKKAIKHGK